MWPGDVVMGSEDREKIKVAWITGASSGIGRALSLRLASDGWTVAASARRIGELEALSRESGGAIHPFPLDVCDRDGVQATHGAIEAALGPVSLAVFAAGTYVRDTPSRFDVDAMRRMVELNLMGTGHCLETVLPGMISRGQGQIGLVGSVSAYGGLPGGGVYGGTKSALLTMSEAMVPELRQKGVRLSVINPGFVKTALTDANDFPMPFMISAENAAERIVKGLRAGRFEIAFPRRMVLSLKLLGLLPYPLYFALTSKMLRKG